MSLDTWISVILPVLSIAIPVFATVYTVNNRIKNENRENHRPYLVLNKVENLEKLDKYSYFLTLIGKNYYEANPNINVEEIKSINGDEDLSVELNLRNIGYGVGTNIKFYDLLTGYPIVGTQEIHKTRNQQLFTTLDMGADSEKRVQANILNTLTDDFGEKVEDHNRILCVYQDLHGNIYSFIISINIKTKNNYDFFAYQPSSKSYKRWIKENKANFKKIIKQYKK